MTIQYACIEEAQGQTILTMQGCLVRCQDCPTRVLWPIDGGIVRPTSTVVWILRSLRLPVSIVGGEPFLQLEQLAGLVYWLKVAHLHVTVHTCLRYEDLLDLAPYFPAIYTTLGWADVLVDGQHMLGMCRRRTIDLQRTQALDQLTLLEAP